MKYDFEIILRMAQLKGDTSFRNGILVFPTKLHTTLNWKHLMACIVSIIVFQSIFDFCRHTTLPRFLSILLVYDNISSELNILVQRKRNKMLSENVSHNKVAYLFRFELKMPPCDNRVAYKKRIEKRFRPNLVHEFNFLNENNFKCQATDWMDFTDWKWNVYRSKWIDHLSSERTSQFDCKKMAKKKLSSSFLRERFDPDLLAETPSKKCS